MTPRAWRRLSVHCWGWDCTGEWSLIFWEDQIEKSTPSLRPGSVVTFEGVPEAADLFNIEALVVTGIDDEEQFVGEQGVILIAQ